MRLKFLFSLVAFALTLPAAAAIPATATTELVEFYNKTLDHYFVTVEPKEIQDLDSGVHAGWARTGYRFLVVKPGNAYPASVPVCRFYGRPEAGRDSHFYSAKVSECDDVKAMFSHAWQLEADEVFRAFLVDPMTGKCPADATPVYRLWNQGPDDNHRYTDQLLVYQEMVSKSYKAEGDGNPAQPVAFCAAGGSVLPVPPAGSPSCTVTATSATPATGSTLTLNAVCTDSPTSFTWGGCTSTTSQCRVSQVTPGAASYSVKATNAAGTGSPVTLNVTWQTPGGALPQCTISGSSSKPAVGSSLTLSASCSQTPTSYQWTDCNYLIQDICTVIPTCSPNQATCTISNSQAGFARYAVAGVNGSGTGPRAGMEVEWTGGVAPPPPAGSVPSCSVITSNAAPVIGNSIVLSANCSGNPNSFAWTGVSCSGSQCSTSSPTAGPQTYTVTATNVQGSSTPASVAVNWQASSGGSGLCSAYSNVINLSTTWGNNTPIDTYNNGGFPGDAVIVISFVAPSTYSSYANAGSTQVAEYRDPATTRQITLSRSPCDFRTPDPTGANGPYQIGNGNTATIVWNVGAGPSPLTPGQTYYVSIRNWSVDLNANSCQAPGCNARIQFNWPSGGSGTPPPPPPGTAPSCTLVPSNASPVVGQAITITADCADSPTSYVWAGCSGSGASCTATTAVSGPRNYSLVASNSFGAGPQANLAVNWQAPPSAAPACSVTANPSTAFVGSSVTLTATCSNAPASYAWTNCSSASSTCVATAAAAGGQTYSVTASNAVGASVPVGTNVTWQAIPGGGADFCGSYASVNRLTTTWGDNTPIDTYKYGGFPGDGVLVFSFVAPATPASYAHAGSTQVAEHGDPAATRHITISRSACDFRAPDPTGANGPYVVGYGNTGTIVWNVGAGPSPLAAGQTYYVSIRNWSVDFNNGAGGISCLGASGGYGSCNARVQFNWPN